MDIIELYKKENADEVAGIEKNGSLLIDQFVKDYPVDKIQELSLNEYCISPEGMGNDVSFCRRLRYELDIIGHMGNVWPDVFGIYLKGGTKVTLSKTFKNIYGEDYGLAFKEIKEEIVKLLNAVEKNDYISIESSRLNNAFKYKLMVVYYPDRFVPVTTRDTLNAYCDVVGIAYYDNDEMVYRNEALCAWKDSISEIREWSNIRLMSFLDWAWRTGRKAQIFADTTYEKDRVERVKKIDDELDKIITGREREAVVKVRVNHDIFRSRLIEKYGKCCLCGVTDKRMLIASHIKPWSVCDSEEKLDVRNGLLLCPNHDSLFDQGFISFDDKGHIIISEEMDDLNRMFMNVQDNMQIEITDGNREYLKYHRANIFKTTK